MSGRIISGERELLISAMQERAARAASGLEALGIAAGDAVAYFLRNDFAIFEVADATRKLGAYAVPINWHLGAEEAGYILNDSGAKALVIHADLLLKVKDAIPKEVTVLVVETPPEIMSAYRIDAEATAIPDGALDWNKWLKGFEPLPLRDVAAPGSMIYTSGTTGNPKGVRRMPADPSEMANLYEVINMAFGLRPGARTIMPAPMYHSAPNTYAALSVALGAEEIVLMPRFDPEEFLKIIDEHKITHVQTVPTMFVRMLKLPEDLRAKYDVSSLEFTVHAAAPCPPHVKEKMIEWWGPVINEYYGSTETSAVVFCTSEEWLAHKGTVGKALPGVGLRVVNEKGEDMPTGIAGDVYCRVTTGPNFTYNNDDKKRAGIELDGLVSVGDIGYLDEDGFLYLCDRRNDMIISGGVNIYPAEIENCLVGHPDIADCAVFGIPDPDFGEAICAYVQPAPGATLSEADVRQHVRDHLAAYKTPKEVVFSNDLPREDSGKIFKRKLKEKYWK